MILPLFSFLLFCIQASQAIICDAGAYFNPNQQSCEYCLKGTYSDTPGRVGGCSRCPAGSRVKNPSYYGNTECVACSAGTYEVDGRECHYCPYGTYSNITGATEGTCKKCPAGYRVKNPSYYGNTECVACPAGTYEVNGRECYYCPYGTYSNVIGATEGTCKKCPAGYRVKDPSYYGNTECVACPAGTYEVNGKECYYCPLGTYSSMIGASGPQSCLPCPSGSVARSTGSTQCTLCQPGEYELNRTSCPYCAQGTYSSTAGSAVCTSCPAGSKTPYWNGNTGCVKCKPGEYERDRVGCPDCPVGTYSSTEGSTQCTPCPAGSKTLYWSGNTGCVKCKPGEYERDRVGCPDCPAGTYSSTEGSTQCTPCPAGWKTPLDYANTKCVQCQAGTYEVDRKSCFSCPEGKYSSPGSSNFSSCLPCPAGSIVNSEKTGCTQCPVGTYSANGVKCTYCPAGTYSDVIGATSCKVCDTGYMTNPNYIGYTKCTPCPPGTSEHDHTACYYCLGGTYSPGAISGCLACPPGTISSNTASKCTPCPAGTYEDSRRSCYYCPAGSHSLPGSVQCTKNFIPAVIERPVNWTRLEITLNNTVDFLEGAVNGLCMEDIGEKVERLENVGDAVGDIWDAWHNVSWTNMSSLKSAIIESSNATMDILEVVEDWTPLSSKRMLQTFIVFAAPPLTPLVLAYEFGAFTYRLGENIKDVTAEIKEIHEGVQNGNFTQAGHGLGSLVKTALELKDLHRELQEEMK